MHEIAMVSISEFFQDGSYFLQSKVCTMRCNDTSKDALTLNYEKVE